MIKRLISILVLLLISASAFAQNSINNGEPQIQGPMRVFGGIYQNLFGIDSKVISATTGNLTLYVRTDGNDNSNCTVDAAGQACLTIQSALDRVPKTVKHTVAINVGAGTFGGFEVVGFDFLAGSLTVTGTLDVPTLGGGTPSGTSTAGDTYTCTDGGQTWVASALRGMLVKVGSEYRIIRDNTGTSIYTVGALSATCNGKVYLIQEQKSLINSNKFSAYGIAIHNCRQASGSMLSSVKNFKLVSPAGGTWAGYTMGVYLERIAVISPASIGFIFQQTYGQNRAFDLYVEHATSYGFSILMDGGNFASGGARGLFAYHGSTDGYLFSTSNVTYIYDLYSESNTGRGVYLDYVDGTMSFMGKLYLVSNTTAGIEAWSVNNMNIDEPYIYGNGGTGLWLEGVVLCDIDDGTISNNGNYGIELDSASGNRSGGSFLNAIATLTIANNTNGGVILQNDASIALSAATGGGNGGYGLTVENGSAATITSATTVTGTTGDATINGGANILTYATHFANNNDAAVNTGTLSKIERKD